MKKSKKKIWPKTKKSFQKKQTKQNKMDKMDFEDICFFSLKVMFLKSFSANNLYLLRWPILFYCHQQQQEQRRTSASWTKKAFKQNLIDLYFVVVVGVVVISFIFLCFSVYIEIFLQKYKKLCVNIITVEIIWLNFVEFSIKKVSHHYWSDSSLPDWKKMEKIDIDHHPDRSR